MSYAIEKNQRHNIRKSFLANKAFMKKVAELQDYYEAQKKDRPTETKIFFLAVYELHKQKLKNKSDEQGN